MHVRPLLVVITALACATAALAQQRERVIGQVLDKNGDAWPDAEVTLFSRAIPGYERGTRTDRVRVESNARGRFRAELLPGRPYSAWAIAAAGKSSYRTTIVVEDVLPGRPIRLHEAKELHHRVTLTVRGAETWKAKAPLRFQVHTCTPVNVLVQRLVLDADQKAVLPPLPGGRAWIEVHGKADYPIYSDFVPLTETEREQYLSARTELWRKWGAAPSQAGKSVTEAVLDIPPPVTLTIQVNNHRTGPVPNPIALRDLKHARGPWYPLATGDTNGRVRFEVPGIELADGSIVVRPFDLLVRHSDYADNFFGSTELRVTRDRGDEPDKTVKLAAGGTVKGRILFGEDRPAAHLPLVVYSSITRGSGGGQIACGPHTFETDENGRFELPGRAKNRVYRLCAVPRAEHIQELPAELASLPLLWLRSSKPTPADLGDIRLDALRTLVIEVQRPDGSACPRETVYAGESFDSGNVPFYPMRYLSDRRGSLRFPMPAAKGVRLVVASTAGAAELGLKQEVDYAGGSVPMVLSTDREIAGRVTDAEKHPLPGGMVLITALRGAGQGTSNWVTIGMLARHNQPGAGELYWTRYWKRRRWARHSHPACAIPVDTDGRFKIFVPPEINQATGFARVVHDGQTIDSPAVTFSTADAAGQTISIPLPAKREK